MALTVKQTEFIKQGNTVLNIAIGATGAGKTYADILFRLPNRLREIKENRYKGIVLICGYSLETIEDNVLSPMRELWGDKLIPEYSKNATKITLFGVPVRLVGASQDKRVNILRGKNVVYAYCDEVVTYSEKFFFMLLSRMRCVDKNGKLVSKIDCTCNPEHSNHWFKKKVLDKEDMPKFVMKFTIFDNEFLPKEFIDNLVNQYKGTVYYVRNIMGEWANAEGLVFPIFTDSLIKENTNYGRFFIDKEYKYDNIVIGVDFGQKASKNIFTATGLVRVGNKYELHVLEEHSVKGDAYGVDEEMIIKEHFEFVKMVKEKYKTRVYQSDTDHYEALRNSMRKYHANNGSSHCIDLVDKSSISLKEYVLKLTGMFNLDKIKISKNCTQLIDALSVLVVDSKTDIPEDKNEVINDCYDSMRYSMCRFLRNRNLDII